MTHRSSIETRPGLNMYRALVGLGLVCSVAIITVYAITKPIIERNHTKALIVAIEALFPAATTRNGYVMTEQGKLQKVADSGILGEGIYAVFDHTRRLLGFAVPASGMGYQDRIGLLYGYDPVTQTIVGLHVLASRETPGLGDRIRHDPRFLENFHHLDVKVSAEHNKLEHGIEVVKHGTKSQPWQIDAITGATVSSRAVGQILAHSTQHWLPVIRASREEIAVGSKTD